MLKCFKDFLADRIGAPKDENGFTLIELLIVIIIMGILTAIIIPVLAPTSGTEGASDDSGAGLIVAMALVGILVLAGLTFGAFMLITKLRVRRQLDGLMDAAMAQSSPLAESQKRELIDMVDGQSVNSNLVHQVERLLSKYGLPIRH